MVLQVALVPEDYKVYKVKLVLRVKLDLKENKVPLD